MEKVPFSGEGVREYLFQAVTFFRRVSFSGEGSREYFLQVDWPGVGEYLLQVGYLSQGGGARAFGSNQK